MVPGGLINSAKRCIVLWEIPRICNTYEDPKNPKVHLSEYSHDPTINQVANEV